MTQKKFIAAAVKAIDEAPYYSGKVLIKCALLDMSKAIGGERFQNKLRKGLEKITN